MIKVVHLTSAHSRYDTRIFVKMCSSLAAHGYDVSLVVADGEGNEVKNGVSIVDVGAKTGGRLSRMTKTVGRVFKKAKELGGDIYHFHDPELIRVSYKLKNNNNRVIFDVHENISLQILDKDYIPFFIRPVVSSLYKMYEKVMLPNFDALILAEKSYNSHYSSLNNRVDVILNMPDIKLFDSYSFLVKDKNEIIYIGGVSKNRGFDVTVEAVNVLKKQFPDVVFHCIGDFNENTIKSVEVDAAIKMYGAIPLFEALQYFKNVKVGLSILKPIPNYTRSYSTKIFEYMALGLPVITSNFELYKSLIDECQCGICIDPNNVQELVDAISYIFTHPLESEQMGKNGRRAVEEKYNWTIEEEKLIKLYKGLL